MSDTVVIAAITGGIQILGFYFNNSLVKYRIEQLEKKVNKHNNLVERMVGVEASTKSAHHRIDRLEGLEHEN